MRKNRPSCHFGTQEARSLAIPPRSLLRPLLTSDTLSEFLRATVATQTSVDHTRLLCFDLPSSSPIRHFSFRAEDIANDSCITCPGIKGPSQNDRSRSSWPWFKDRRGAGLSADIGHLELLIKPWRILCDLARAGETSCFEVWSLVIHKTAKHTVTTRKALIIGYQCSFMSVGAYMPSISRVYPPRRP